MLFPSGEQSTIIRSTERSTGRCAVIVWRSLSVNYKPTKYYLSEMSHNGPKIMNISIPIRVPAVNLGHY